MPFRFIGRFVWLYVRCVIANKYLYLSYLSLLFGLSLMWIDHITHTRWEWYIMDMVLVGGGLLTLCLARFGYASLGAYALMMEHFNKYGRVDERFAIMLMGTYCTCVGLHLALQDINRSATEGASV